MLAKLTALRIFLFKLQKSNILDWPTDQTHKKDESRYGTETNGLKFAQTEASSKMKQKLFVKSLALMESITIVMMTDLGMGTALLLM